MLNLGRIFLTTLLVLQASYFKLASSSITTLSSCACEYNGHIYNISSLAKTDGARFKASISHYEYGYNPCIPFVQGDSPGCQNVAICYWSDDGQRHDGIGFQQNVRCQVNNGVVELIFEQKGTREGMVSTVQFKCNESKTLASEAKMNIIRDAAEPILEIEHKCCCPDGCPVNVPPTSSPSPTVVSLFTLPPPSTFYMTSYTSYMGLWIALAVAAVFITVFLISIGFFCHRRTSSSGYHGIVRTQRRPYYRRFLSASANDQSRSARSREQEEQDRLPGYGAVGGALLIPPPYGDVHNDNDNETRREGVEHEEQQPDLHDALTFGVPEDGFTNPVQDSERMSWCSEKNK